MPSVSKTVPEVLGRQSRARRFGIDCPSELRWHAKEPGGDYKQKLILKNVSNGVIKFKYKLPATSFFFLNFPDLITLCPGMDATIEISFRPIRSEIYDDVIEFISSNGTFFIRVLATLPEHGVRMQEYLDFGFSTVKEESRKTFSIRNVGEINAPFELLVESPFSVEPDKGMTDIKLVPKGFSGSIPPGKDASIFLKFLPMEASVFVGTVICKQSEGRPTLVMKISGIGKIPFILVSQQNMDFGSVLTGQTKVMELLLTNTTLVPVSFQLKPLVSDRDPVFFWGSSAGRVPADATLAITVKYCPLATGSFDCEYFDFITPGGNHQRVCCKGYAEPHNVAISPNAINFGNLELGKVSLRTVEICNKTNDKAFYQFVTDPSGCFELSRTDGSIIPQSSIHADIRFKARLPGNFYRRLFLIVKNQGPLYIDLTATAYYPSQDQIPRPMPLTPKHVENYRVRQLEQRTAHMMAIMDTGTSGDPFAEVWSEFFLDDTDNRREVFLQEQDVEFGGVHSVGLGEYKNIVVSNNTNVKQTAVFMVPADGYVQQPEGAGEVRATTLGPVLVPLETCFKVFPESADIMPRSTTTFRVAFRPTYGNAYYAQALEVFIFPKTQRNFRLVTEDNFVPPHCLRPVCSGNTFPPGMEAFTPKLRVPATRINFPACCAGDRAYQVVEMFNDADTPMRFQLEQDESGIFRAKPNNGLIMPHCAQLVAFAFRPVEARRYEHVLTCLMNGNLRHSVQITLVGSGSSPSLVLEPVHLQIKPTCIGAVSTRTAELHNTSDVPVSYEVEIPESCERIIGVEPRTGVLRGHERLVLYCHFAPKRRGPLSMRIPIAYQRAAVKTLGDTQVATYGNNAFGESMGSVSRSSSTATKLGPGQPQRLMLNVHGAGTGGLVQFDPEVIDFGTLLVGSEVQRVLLLVNGSDCAMYYNMESSMPQNVTYKDGKGILPAFASKRVTLCFTPESRLYYNVYLTCRLRTGSEAEETGDFADHTGSNLVTDREIDDVPKCHVLGNAVYPMLACIDARSEGLSASRVWREFGLIKMNAELSADLTPMEVSWNRADIDETDPSKVLPVIEMRFPVKEEGSLASFLIMRVKNTGLLPLDFALRYPKDDEDEPENWVDGNLQSEEERTLSYILEHKLFVCQPRRGHLEMGEEIDIVLSYKHAPLPTEYPLSDSRSPEFRLPVVLAVCEMSPGGGVHNTGKQVVLALIGKTVRPGEPHLHLPVADSRFFKHNLRINPEVTQNSEINPTVSEWGFERTPVGLLTPPIQYYVLHNNSTVPIEYSLDLSEVDDLNSRFFEFDIVKCLDSPDGTLEPGQSATLRWIFNPIEARSYTWTVPISVEGGESCCVRFMAEGFTPKAHDQLPPAIWPLPLFQRLPIPNQVVTLTLERFVLEDIPVGSVSHRMVILTNRDPDQIMLYQFEHESENVSDLMTFFPSEGEIPAGGHAIVRLTVRVMMPAVLDLDVRCSIKPLRPPEDEEEDLVDDNEQAASTGRTGTSSARPGRSGGGHATPVGSSTGSKAAGSRARRTSIVESAPPYRGTTIKSEGKSHSVTFNDVGAARRKSTGGGTLDDTASVKSATSGVTSGRRGSTSLAAIASTSSSPSNSSFENHSLDMTLYLSVQATVRSCDEHRQLLGGLDKFHFPKSTKSLASASQLGITRPGSSNRDSSSLSLLRNNSNIETPARSSSTTPLSSVGRMAPFTRQGMPGSSGGLKVTSGAARAAVTEGILEQLLMDVMADEDILLALSDLDPAPVPCYVQITARPPTPFRLNEPATRKPSSRDLDPEDYTSLSSTARSGRPAPLTIDTVKEDGSEQRPTVEKVCAGVDVPGHSAAIPAELSEEEQKLVERNRLRRLAFALPEVENLAAFVLDSCLFNMLSEVIFGEDTLI